MEIAIWKNRANSHIRMFSPSVVSQLRYSPALLPPYYLNHFLRNNARKHVENGCRRSPTNQAAGKSTRGGTHLRLPHLPRCPSPAHTPLIKNATMNLVFRTFAITLPQQFLYIFILIFSVFCVLLPASVASYLSFYKSLVPAERVSAPLRFRPAEGHPHERWTGVETQEVLPFIRENRDLGFSVRLRLNAVCKAEKLVQALDYVLEMPPTQIHNGYLLVNCDERYIYVEKNHWVPYKLRYWVPPILVDILKHVAVDEQLFRATGEELVHTLVDNATLTFADASAVLIDSKTSTVDFVIEWDGIRYYLVNYYWTSMVLGAGAMWFTSSLFCLLTALATLAYFLHSPEVKQECVRHKEEKDER